MPSSRASSSRRTTSARPIPRRRAAGGHVDGVLDGRAIAGVGAEVAVAGVREHLVPARGRRAPGKPLSRRRRSHSRCSSSVTGVSLKTAVEVAITSLRIARIPGRSRSSASSISTAALSSPACPCVARCRGSSPSPLLSGAPPPAPPPPARLRGPEPGHAPPAPRPKPLSGGSPLDHVTGLKPMLSSLAALPEPPTARVYFDVHEPASYYAAPVAKIAGVAAGDGRAAGLLRRAGDHAAAKCARGPNPTCRRWAATWRSGRSATRSTATGPGARREWPKSSTSPTKS